MTPKKIIMKFIQKACTRSGHQENGEVLPVSEGNTSEQAVIRELFDGMSTGTARIIVDREVGHDISEAFSVSTLENKGRYSIAKILRPDGSPIQRLLIDKQTRKVQMVGL